MKKIIFLSAALLLSANAFSQTGNVGINTSTPNPNAVLDVVSTNKGLLPPRVALTATNSPAPLGSNIAGMVVYNTATAGTAPNNVTPGLYYNDGTIWISTTETPVTTVSNATSLAGSNSLSTTVNGVIGTNVTVPNIYTADGTLTANRVITTGANTLTFQNGANNTTIESGSTSDVITRGSFAGFFRAFGGTSALDLTATNGGTTQISSSGSATNLLLGSVNNTPVNFMTNSFIRASISPSGVFYAGPVGGSNTTLDNTGFNSLLATTSLANTATIRAVGGNRMLELISVNGGENQIYSWNGSRLVVGTMDASPMTFITNAQYDRIYIAPNGNVGIGTNAPTSKFSVNGSADKPGGGSWGTFSDRRVKKDIADFNDGLSVISKLKAVTYKYNEKSGYTDLNKEYVGFIAQDVEKVAPYMVKVIDDTKKSGLVDKRELDESALTKILVNAVKELHTEIIALKKEVEMLKK